MKFSTVETNLRNRGYVVNGFDTVTESVKYLDMQIENKRVGFGGSMTLEEMGLFEMLQSYNTLCNQM